jgi:PAS domain S-box-containing protein
MSANDNASSIGDILIVDDTLTNSWLLTNILSGAGYQVRPTEDGELALRSVQAKHPALILLDIRMPGVNGFDVCRRLKADESTRDIPVIFLSALTDTLDKSKGFALGAVDYIVKPYDAQEVLARVKTHVSLSLARRQLKTQNLHLQQANEQLSNEIAERKRAEEALRESYDRLNGIYASVGEGVITVDVQQRIVLFNSAAERMFGHSATAVIGQPLSILLPQRVHALHEAHIRHFDASGQSNRTMGTFGQIYALRASGEEFLVEATVSQSGKAPNKLFTVILRDIAKGRQAEGVLE